MTGAFRSAFSFELRKLLGATVTRVATLATVLLVSVTTAGGYAATLFAPDTDQARKVSDLMTASGWDGYTALAATSAGISVLLAAGVVAAWTTGREFTDGTVVGLFALPTSTAAIARAKVLALLAWATTLGLASAACTTVAGLALGLAPGGAPRSLLAVTTVGVLLGASALPAMWVATLGRGYLAGIAATLALVVVTNVAAGFGVGQFIPWAIPTLWALPHSAVPDAALLAPAAAALAGGVLTIHAWAHRQLGNP